MACKYYVNGKWITEVEFKAHLLGGALENAINSGVEIEGYPKMEAKDSVSDEDYPESVLSDEEELSEEERVQKERDMFGEYIQQEAPQEFTEDELDQITSSYYMDDEGVVRDYDGDETTIEAVVEKAKELKQGTIFETGDGKYRFVREGEDIVMKDAQGRTITAPKYKTIKGKKIKIEPSTNVAYIDQRLINKYNQERLGEGLEEGQSIQANPANPEDRLIIAEDSTNPQQIKEAWEQEKMSLRDEVDQNDKIYDAVATYGVRAKDFQRYGDNKLVKDGSVSALGWFSSQALPMDIMAQQIGVEIEDIISFIKKYNKGPNQYKAEREYTLKALADKYKQVTGVDIKTKVKPVAKPEAKVSVSKEEPITAEEVKKEIEEEKIVDDAIAKKKKEIADRLKNALKSKPRTIKWIDENGNEIESPITKLGIGLNEWNDLVDVFAEAFASAVVKGQKYKIALKATLEYLRDLDSFKALGESEREAIEQDLKQFLKENSGVKFKKVEKKPGVSQARTKIASAEEGVSEEVKSKFSLTYLRDSIKNMTQSANDIWTDIKEEVEKNGGTREDAIEAAEKAIMDLNFKMRISQRGALSLIIAKQLHGLRGKEGITLDQIADYDYRADKLLNAVADILTESAQTLSTLGKFMTDYLMAYPENIIEEAKKTIDKINDKKAPISDESVMSLTEMVEEILSNPEGVAELEARGYGKQSERISKKYTNKKAALKSGYDKFLDDFDESYKGMMMSTPISPALFKAGVKAMAQAHMKLLDIAQAVELAIAKMKELSQDPFDEAKARANLKYVYKKIDEEAQQDLESQNKNKIAAFGKLFSQPIPKDKKEVKSKQEKINELAKELDAIFGTDEYSKLAEGFESLKEAENQKKVAEREKKIQDKLDKIAEREKEKAEAKAKKKAELEEKIKQKLAEQLEKKKQKEAEKKAAYEAKLKESQDAKTAKIGEKDRIKKAMEAMNDALAELDKAKKERMRFQEGLKNLTGLKLKKFAEKITQEYMSGRNNLTPSDIKRAYQAANGGISLTQKELQIVDNSAKIITQGLAAINSGTLTPVQIRILSNNMAQASTKITDILNPRRWRDLVEASMIGNYFSVPTILANAVSNAIKKAYERTGGVILNMVDVLFEPGMANLRGENYVQRVKRRFDERYGKRGVAASIAQIEMLVPALKMAGKAIKEGGVSSDELGKVGAKYQAKPFDAWKNISDNISKQTTTFNKVNEGLKSVYEGTAGVFPTFFLRALVAGDIAARVPEQAKIEQQIANMLGVPVEVLLTNDNYSEWRETAKELARFSVFQQNNVISWLYGKATAPAETSWGEVRKWIALLAMMPIAPFKGTPVNVVYELMKFIPLVQAPELIYRITQSNNKELTAAERYKHSRRAQSDMKKLVASVPMYFAVSALLKAGVLIVGYELPDDEKERTYKRQNLGSPLRLTINIEGIDQYTFDAQRLGPIFSYITLVDSFNKSWKESGGDPYLATEELLGTMKKTILEQTFLTGINNLVKAMESETRLRNLLIDTYGNAYFNALMPATFTNITKMMDDDKYVRVMKDESFLKELYNKTIVKRLGFLNIPGAKMEELKPAYSLWGQPIKTDNSSQIDVIHYLFDFTRSEDMTDFSSANKSNEIIFKKFVDSKNKEWIPPMAPRDENFDKGSYKYTTTDDKEVEGTYDPIGNIKLTPDLRNEYQKILGEQSQYEVNKMNGGQGVLETTTVEQITIVYEKAKKRAKKIFYHQNKEALTKRASK